jgi:hypothetical protein
MIALCFVVVGRLRNADEWKAWADPTLFRFIFHISRGTPEFVEWARKVGDVVPELKTEWGGQSVLEAMLSTYTHAFSKLDCHHAVMLSENHVPLGSAVHVSAVLRSLKKRSLVDLNPASLSLQTEWVISSCWIVLSRTCFDVLQKYTAEVQQLAQDVENLRLSGRSDVGVDEIVIPTILFHRCPNRISLSMSTVQAVAGFPCSKCAGSTDYCGHAKLLTPHDAAMQFIQCQVTGSPTATFARKLEDMSRSQFLQLSTILSGGARPKSKQINK